mgnify:FL=1
MINRENLLSAVDRVSTIANEKSPSIKFKLFKNLINLSSINNENSTATEDIIANYNGNEIEIGFNSRYIMDILDNLDGEEIKISFNDNSKVGPALALAIAIPSKPTLISVISVTPFFSHSFLYSL